MVRVHVLSAMFVEVMWVSVFKLRLQISLLPQAGRNALPGKKTGARHTGIPEQSTLCYRRGGGGGGGDLD